MQKNTKKYKKIVMSLMLLGMLTSCELGSDSSKSFNGKSYKTVKSPYTGRIWMDRNVGAKRVCQSVTDEKCFGDYFQYGRAPDGHEKKNSKTRDTPITYLDKADDRFVIGTWDWYIGNKDLETIMDKLDGSGMCPKGFRVPTKDEYFKEFYKDGSSAELEPDDSLFNTFLKIPASGYRDRDTGKYESVGTTSWLHDNKLGSCQVSTVGRPIRCIKATKEEIENARDHR